MDNINRLSRWQTIIISAVYYLSMVISAQAGVIVTEWEFDTWAEFTASTFDSGSGTTNFTDYELSWGAGIGDYTSPTGDASSNRSALTVGTGTSGDDRFGGGHATGTVDTIMGPGAPVSPEQVGLGISMTHWNNIISSDFSQLTAGTLTDHLTLNAISPYGGADKDAPTLDIEFKFLETPNEGSGGFCLDGSSVGDHPGGCGDLFGFDNISTTGIPFSYDGNSYGLDVLLFDEFGGAAPIEALGSDYCAALGLNDSCVGFVTPEIEHTSLQFGFSIRQVPEPQTVILLGIALVAFGLRKFNC